MYNRVENIWREDKKVNYLEKRILKDGIVKPGNVLKVDSFLNHQIDPIVMEEVVDEFLNYFGDREITKVITIEASGIAPAIMLAAKLKVPMLFAKKTEPSTLTNDTRYEAMVHSYTKNITSNVIISKEYLDETDSVLIIDDFLANGQAALGLADIVKQSGAKVAGIGICIEKSFQQGHELIKEAGIDLFSICRIQSLDNGEVTFVEEV